MSKAKLTLLGGQSEGTLQVSARVLADTLDAILDVARLATRFYVEGESSRKGPRPAWLEEASTIAVTSLAPGSVAIGLKAPKLRQVDPDRFGGEGQMSLFTEVEKGTGLGDQTAFDIAGGFLASVLEAPPHEILADRALLDACVRLVRSAGDQYRGIRLEGLRGRDAPIELKPEDAKQLESLRDQTPAPQAVRLTGTLDTISASRPHVVLTMNDGTRVPARQEEHDPALLQELFESKVVVSGMAHFKPSGKLQFIRIEWMGPAGENDELFATVPRHRELVPVVPAVSEKKRGIFGFFGTWPGDESEEEILEALKELE